MELRLAIAEVVISVLSERALELDPMRTQFIADEPAHAKVRLHSSPPVLPESGSRVVDGTVFGWELVRANDRLYAVYDGELGRGWSGIVGFPERDSTFDIYMPFVTQTQGPLRDGLSLYKVPIVSLLPHMDGILLHGAGVVDHENGAGYLFTGVSGVGKTTMARLWKDTVSGAVLNDEFCIARFVDGRFYLYGTPWLGSGRICHAGKAPLCGVFFLGHGSRNTIQPLEPGESLAGLVAQAFLPVWDKESVQNELDICASIVHSTPCSRLDFLPEPTVIRWVREYLGHV